jgi:RNA polymerase sporulation-specific sigma factor
MGKLGITEAENIELLKRAKNGDEEAKTKFFQYHQRLAHHIARKFEKSAEYDELYGQAIIGLTKAYNTFDPEKDVKFATYASRVIANDICMYLRRVRKWRKEDSLDHVVASDKDDHELTLMETLESPESEAYDNYTIWQAFSAVMDEFKQQATERELLFVQRRFIENKLQAEIAEELGFSQSYIARIEKKILTKLRKLALKHDLIEGDDETMGGPKVNVSYLKYAFENYTALSSNQIAKAFGYSLPTVHRYREEFKKNGLDVEADPSANEILIRYIAQLTDLEKRQLQNRIRRERQKAYEAPSEVVTYNIYEQEQKQEHPESMEEETQDMEHEQALKEIAVGSTELHDEVKIEIRLNSASVDNIADFLETLMNQLKRDQRYDFGVVVYQAERTDKQ